MEQNRFSKLHQKKIRCIDTSMFFSEKHRNIDVGKHR